VFLHHKFLQIGNTLNKKQHGKIMALQGVQKVLVKNKDENITVIVGLVDSVQHHTHIDGFSISKCIHILLIQPTPLIEEECRMI
jgi:hypothetical protein